MLVQVPGSSTRPGRQQGPRPLPGAAVVLRQPWSDFPGRYASRRQHASLAHAPAQLLADAQRPVDEFT
jgi:hypothetical protein